MHRGLSGLTMCFVQSPFKERAFHITSSFHRTAYYPTQSLFQHELFSMPSFFFLSTPTSPSRTRPKTGLSVLGDEPCRLNGTTQALGEPVEINHLHRTINRVPRGSHPPDRPSGLTLPLRPSASHHRQRIPVRQLSEDYSVPGNLGQHPGPGLVPHNRLPKQAWGPFQAHAAGQHAILGGKVQQGELNAIPRQLQGTIANNECKTNSVSFAFFNQWTTCVKWAEIRSGCFCSC